MSRIEQIIDEIEEFIEGCKPVAFSQNKVIVPKDELYELLTELRLKTPEEIKRYQKIIANRDQIIDDAKAQAQKMLDETTAYTNSLVEEHSIMLKAYERAEEVMNDANAQAEETINAANEDAENIRRSALEYTQELITNLESVVGSALETSRTNSQNLIDGLSYNFDLIQSNKEALESQLAEPEKPEEVEAQEAAPAQEEQETSQQQEPEQTQEANPDKTVEINVSEPSKDETVKEPVKEQPKQDSDEDDEFDYDDID